MKNNEIKDSINNIKPDPYMKTRLSAKVVSYKTKRNKNKKLFTVISVLCAAFIIFGTGFGLSNGSITNNHNVIGSTESSEKDLNTNGGVMIAYAGMKDAKLSENAEEFTEYPMMYKIGSVDIRGMSEQEIEIRIKEIRENFSKTEKQIDNEKITICMKASIERLDNVIVYQFTNGVFNIDIDNPDEVKRINVKHSGKYGYSDIYTKYIKDKNGKYTDPKSMDNYIIGADISLDGDIYAENIKKQKKENTSGYFQINWKMSDVLYKKINNNPDMDFSAVYDVMTFTVEFKNGDVAESIVDINFDSDGNMFAKCRSYDYFENK